MRKSKIVLIILAICIFLSSIMVQLSISAESTILNANFYSKFVEKHNLYTIPQNFVLLKIKNNTSCLDENTYNVLTKATASTFSREWTQEQVSGLISNLLGYLKNTNDELDLRIDFRTKKSEFITEMIPMINTDETDSMDKLMVSLAEHLSTSSGIPDYLDLQYTSYFKNSNLMEYIDQARTFYPYSKYLPFLLFAFFFLALLFMFKLSNTFKITGYVLSSSGLIVIIFISYISGILDNTITAQLSSSDELLALTGNNPKILASIFKNSILAVSNRIAIIFCLSGIVFYAAGRLSGKLMRSSDSISANV